MNIAVYKKQLVNQLLANYNEQEAVSVSNILLMEVLQFSKIELITHSENELLIEQLSTLNNAAQRLLNAEPVQYVIGKAPFLNLELTVNKNVLIPRNETEELVMWIYNDFKNNQGVKILDIGTGSGCIALGLKYLMPEAKVFATDVSEGALQVAKQNALNNNLNVNFIKNDILNPETWLTQKFDIIVSNPPYITKNESHLMPKNVLEHEPHLALFSNNGALTFYNAISKFANQNLNSNGSLYFEINEFNLEPIINNIQRQGFSNVTPKKDLNGKWRMIRGKR